MEKMNGPVTLFVSWVLTVVNKIYDAQVADVLIVLNILATVMAIINQWLQIKKNKKIP